RIKQQAVALRKYFEKSPQKCLTVYYFMMHLYSISNSEDADLRHLYLNKIIANDNCPMYQDINNIFYNVLLKFKCGTETIHFPVDRKWLPDTTYRSNIILRSNRFLLAMYYSLHRHCKDTFIQDSNKKGKYDLLKYSSDVKSGRIQDRIGDVVVRQASALVENCDTFFDSVFVQKEIVISDKEVIKIMSLLQWQIAFIFYNILLKFKCGTETIHFPVDRKWLPDTTYRSNIILRSNRFLLAMYYSLHRHCKDTFIQDCNKKGKYDLLKYSSDVKSGKIQDRIGDVVVREASALVENCDTFFDSVFTEKEIVISDKEVIKIMSLLQWQIAFVNQLLTHHVNKKEIIKIKEIISNLHVCYKWFIKNCLNKITSLFNMEKDQNIFKIVATINSNLTSYFDRLRKLGRRFQKQSLRPPPLTNSTQLAIIPEYHKLVEVFHLGKSANISKTLTKLSDEGFASLLINLKSKLDYDMQEIPENYNELKEAVGKFVHQVDHDQFEKFYVDYLLITDYLSLITMYQQRNTMEDAPCSVSVPCTLQGVIKQYQTTKDKRLMDEITSQTTQYLLNNPSTMPSKYLNYKSNDENIQEAVLSWHNPILTYLLTSILVTPNSRTLNLKVDLKSYHYAMELYDKFNCLLWKNSYQLSDIECNFMNLENEYIKNKRSNFLQSFGASLNLNVNNKDTTEITNLCLQQIELIETNSQDKKEVWRSFLMECGK
ncbi:hypothetical protein AMK59_8480, partial [Oryctes borbonicus]